ncbi:hypothetical protein [Stutzerimonas stutzeri]|uniref:Uncharacterized protein n=1 Tax=Stutzerimonas stutzeri TaxID=316 RepID=A0A6I6LWL4_STUST|nr:hypothetical protein [Stutzerimonas stutzeri]QGZ31052.1 hypothetical protein GQA94_13635 [Stutzerimonas stutzeri]
MSAAFKEVDSQTVSRLAKDMNHVGVAFIERYLCLEHLVIARREIEGEARRHGDRSFAIRGNPDVAGTFFERLACSNEFQRLLLDVHACGTGRVPSSFEKVQTVIRCLQGRDSDDESNRFHYDATMLTVLLPVFIPEPDTDAGRFVVFPNVRNLRSSGFLNLLEKALVQNRISQRCIALAIRVGLLRPMKVPLVPGNLYFFWGYRSLHANEPCTPNELRTTVLFHYDNPHRRSSPHEHDGIGNGEAPLSRCDQAGRDQRTGFS